MLSLSLRSSACPRVWPLDDSREDVLEQEWISGEGASNGKVRASLDVVDR